MPQVVVPLFAADQWLNARRIEALGAGIALEHERAAFDAPGPPVADALPPVQDAVRLLERYASGAGVEAPAVGAVG